MRLRLGLGIGAAVGYVLGAKAGQQRYEDLKVAAGRVVDNPIAQSATSFAQAQAEKVEDVVRDKLGKPKAPSEEAASPEDNVFPDKEGAPLDAAATAIGESWADSIEGNLGDIPDK